MNLPFARRSIALMLLAFLLGCRLQDKMLYYPDSFVPGEAEAAARGLRFWPAAAEYRGFVGTGAPREPRGTVVVFHGNAGTAADRLGYVAALEPLGYRVVLAEYPGYGRRPGSLGEASFVADARETLRLVEAGFGGRVLVLGESLGAGVAAAVAREPPVPLGQLLLVTPWDTLRAVARTHFPHLPLGLFLRDAYDSVANLQHFRGRVALVAAERDRTIPLAHARTLERALSCPKRLWVVPSADHNDWMEGLPRGWWAEVMAFVSNPSPPG